MAENTLTEVPAGADAPEEAKGGKKKLLIVGVVLAIAAAAGAYLFLGGGAAPEEMSEEETAAAAEAQVADLQAALASGAAIDPTTLTPEQLAVLAPPTGEVLEVGAMTVNLEGDGASYGRVGFAIVLQPDVDPSTVEMKFPILRDEAISEIMSYTAEALRTPEGVQALRDGLAARFRAHFPLGEIDRVVLTELLVQ